MVDKLEACPFCGHEGVLHSSSDGEVEWVRCVHCGQEGPLAYSSAEAIQRWNAGEVREAKATRTGWDHRYRQLAFGEIIEAGDECRRDDGTWVTGICVGEPAPDPAYTSHRVYRRLKGALVDGEQIAQIATAIGKADAAFGYSFNLTRLVDGEETHTLSMPGFDPVEFSDRDEGYAFIAERRNKARAEAILATLSTPTEDARERVVPPVNGEPDPEWASIRRAIDQFAGRVPKIGKHHALNTGHIADVVARLDVAGDAEAADTIVWQCWWRALDRERERFLLSDAAEQRSDARERVKVLEEALREIVSAVEQDRGFNLALARTALGNKETDRHG